jgi:hypothetical protein
MWSHVCFESYHRACSSVAHMTSQDVIRTSIGLASDLKLGQYLKIPPRAMFIAQVWGTLLGAFVNYAVMASIVSSQREILVDPVGTAVWAGQWVQSLNSDAISWSLAGYVYGTQGYIWVSRVNIYASGGRGSECQYVIGSVGSSTWYDSYYYPISHLSALAGYPRSSRR